MCGGRFYFIVFRRLSTNPQVKELLKSVHICQSYRKNKSGTFFYGPRCRSLHDHFLINSTSTFPIASRALAYSIASQKLSCRKPNRCQPPGPLLLIEPDQFPIELIWLDWVDLFFWNNFIIINRIIVIIISALLIYSTPWAIKTCHFILGYNFHISWQILPHFVPMEAGMNTMYSLISVSHRKSWKFMLVSSHESLR